ncbi:MAG: hypothetical protein HYX63_13380 [Gammaproteobacteria bacterium]|nr:hypothetical protein [Gammaproteobacteria bacterium]
MTKAKDAAAPAATAYQVREPLRLDGVDYQPGDTIELSERQVDVLRDLKVLDLPLPPIDPNLAS